MDIIAFSGSRVGQKVFTIRVWVVFLNSINFSRSCLGFLFRFRRQLDFNSSFILLFLRIIIEVLLVWME